MPADYRAAVGYGIKEALRIVPHEMQPDSKPQASRAAHCEAEEQTDHAGAQGTQPRLSPIVQMYTAKQRRKQNRRRPEPDGSAQSEKGVPAKKEFLAKADRHKCRRPGTRIMDEFQTM